MNMATKKSIFEEHLKAWLTARGDKKKRGEIIRHVCFTAKVHPKSVPRSFKRAQMKDRRIPEQRGRNAYYTPDVTAALKELWDAAGEPCGENLHALVPEYVRILERDGMWRHGDETTGKLLAMSEGTMKLRVRAFGRAGFAARGRSTTKPGSILSVIPVRMDGWGASPLGTAQVDTVAHCDDSTAGDFIYTVNAADVTTLWGERRAQWNKGAEATTASLQTINRSIPFPVLEWHPDTGSEFINWHAKRLWDALRIRLTRSRPNHKNDNCFVEERNGHVVRRYVGYARLDAREAVLALNALYDALTPYLNHFVASRRIVSKERVGARWKITHEKKALTPYERVLLREDAPTETKTRLRILHESLNPLVLKREIDQRRRKLFTIQKRHGNTGVW